MKGKGGLERSKGKKISTKIVEERGRRVRKASIVGSSARGIGGVRGAFNQYNPCKPRFH